MEKQTLFHHKLHPHVPKNINEAHRLNQGINDRIAVFLTQVVGSMPTAYTFVILALIGLCAILNIIPPLIAILIAWLSQTFIQLVLLPVIMVGQNVLNEKQAEQLDEQCLTTQKIYHDIGEIVLHLNHQDDEAIKQTALLITIEQRLQLLEEKAYVRQTRGRKKAESDSTSS